ncbi:MAG: hypothetical protein JXR89_02105 [Deltaproteobacteria bacterium]|nr:hypothetical protein [Deltaproteobacteria bacterium]
MKKILCRELEASKRGARFAAKPGQEEDKLKKWISELNHIEKFGSVLDPESQISIWFLDYFENPLSEYDQLLDEFAEYEEILKLAAALKDIHN